MTSSHHKKLSKLPGWRKFCKGLTAQKTPASEYKRILLKMARPGIARPGCAKHEKTRFGCWLKRFTNPKLQWYDREFDTKIRKLAPHWFVDSIALTKQLILRLAGTNLPRPSDLSMKISHYCLASPEFEKKLKKKAPHWFRDTAYWKELLIKTAKEGKPRPTEKSMLGHRLRHYLFRNPQFQKQIRNIAPHWFRFAGR